jgi:hypothetical protein
MKIKDGIIKNEAEIRAMHPKVSFAESTYAELGWQDYVTPVEPETPEQAAQRLERALDNFIQGEVWKRGFDSLNSARGVAGLPGYDGPRKTVALAVAVWAENCYDIALTVKDAVIRGERAMPTEAELLAEMPALTVAVVR